MHSNVQKLIKDSIKTIPDYPIPGILFRDVTSLIENGDAFSATINEFVMRYKDKKIDKVVGTEARGFIFGAPLAAAIGAGFVPVRKPNNYLARRFKRNIRLNTALTHYKFTVMRLAKVKLFYWWMIYWRLAAQQKLLLN